MKPDDIKRVLKIDDPSHVLQCIQNTLKDDKQRETVFQEIMKLDPDLKHDLFTEFFQEENANRKTMKQDFTPECLCDLLSRLSRKADHYTDICCGSGGLSVGIWAENPGSYFQMEELSELPFLLAIFNMAIRNANCCIAQRDVLSGDVKACYRLKSSASGFSSIIEANYHKNAVADLVANPPYSLKAMLDNSDERWKDFDVPPASKVDYAFVLDGLSRLKDKGQMIFILPHGVLFRGAREGKIRKKLLELGYIHAVIGLPEKLFAVTSIPVVLLVVKKEQTSSVLFVDASREFEKGKAQNRLNADHIRKIVDTFEERKEIDRYSRLVSLSDIKENDFNLNIPRYVDSHEPEEEIDLIKTMKRINETEEEIQKTKRSLDIMMSQLFSGSEEDEMKELMALLKV